MTHTRKETPAEAAVRLAGVAFVVSGAVYAVGSGVYSLAVGVLKR